MQSADSDKAARPCRVLGSALLMAFFRVGFFIATLFVLVPALLLRSARADVQEVLWALGSQVMEFPTAPHEGARQLQLNGVRISFRTQTVEAPLVDVLDYYEGACGPSIATQTARSESAGYIACLYMGEAPDHLGGLANRFLRFAETADLGELGDARYIFAHHAATGSTDRTFLLTMWADSGLDLHRLLPREDADAAGSDLDGMPRPSGSQRILSAWEERQPSGVLVYRVVSKSAEELEIFYRTQFLANGWTIVERNTSESIQIDGTHMIAAERDGRLVTVLSHSGEGPQTVLTILVSEAS